MMKFTGTTVGAIFFIAALPGLIAFQPSGISTQASSRLHHQRTASSLKGVTGCTQWLRKTFPDAFWEAALDSVEEVQCDHAYIDSNGERRTRSKSHSVLTATQHVFFFATANPQHRLPAFRVEEVKESSGPLQTNGAEAAELHLQGDKISLVLSNNIITCQACLP
jgi:hypothetical protein